MTKEFIMHCDHCGRRLVVRDHEALKGLQETPLSVTPAGIPDYDVEKKKINPQKIIPRRRMFKCTGCGRGVMLRENAALPGQENHEEEDFRLGREGSAFGPQVP